MDDDGNVDSEVFIGTMPEEFKSYAMEVVKKCSDVGKWIGLKIEWCPEIL